MICWFDYDKKEIGDVPEDNGRPRVMKLKAFLQIHLADKTTNKQTPAEKF